MASRFTTPLSITSQFSFCSLPVRLDSYRGCSFSCAYCFATQRGGASPAPQIAKADPEMLRHALARSDREGLDSRSPLIQMLARRVPIHFGGMSDPFQPAERKWQVSRAFLEILNAWKYPVVISTKSRMIGEDRYTRLLAELNYVVVQFSMSTVNDAQAKLVEPHSSAPSDLLRTMETLSRQGIKVTSRWQPFIPGFSDQPNSFVTAIASSGAKHLSFEHLKVPVERRKEGANATIAQARSIYRDSSARRDGREYVLRASNKLNVVTEVRSECHRYGLTFGAGDNELLHLSDTEGCCSGVDRFAGFENVFRYTVACAVRRSIGNPISMDWISNEWRPTGSIDRYLNSRSRLAARLSVDGTIEDHIRYRWNDPSANGGPASFFGVEARNTRGGHTAFDWSFSFQKTARKLALPRTPPKRSHFDRSSHLPLSSGQ
jgi:DNA repair photolyase